MQNGPSPQQSMLNRTMIMPTLGQVNQGSMSHQTVQIPITATNGVIMGPGGLTNGPIVSTSAGQHPGMMNMMGTPGPYVQQVGPAPPAPSPSPASHPGTPGPQQQAGSSSLQTGQVAAGVAASALCDSKRITELVAEVDPLLQVDDDVEELLLQLSDEFVEQVCEKACRLSKHRGASSLEPKDLQMILEREWNLYVPGFPSEESRHPKKSHVTEAHKQRMAIIKKQLKKS